MGDKTCDVPVCVLDLSLISFHYDAVDFAIRVFSALDFGEFKLFRDREFSLLILCETALALGTATF